jgi:hypothetical protein
LVNSKRIGKRRLSAAARERTLRGFERNCDVTPTDSATLLSSIMSGMKPEFLHLNAGWNAEPNAPAPVAEVQGFDILLRFYLNPFEFKEFEPDELGFLRFVNCERYRLGPTNDEGWYRGLCRFSHVAPKWGEFYEVSSKPEALKGPTDWELLNTRTVGEQHHFLFYFRDNTFECTAESCAIEPRADNALVRARKDLPVF